MVSIQNTIFLFISLMTLNLAFENQRFNRTNIKKLNIDFELNYKKTVEENREDIVQCYDCKGFRNCVTPSIVKCRANNKTNEQIMCYTKLDNSDNVQEKGCKNHILMSQIESESMKLCSGNKCNNEVSSFQATDCIFCSSSTNLKCLTNPSEVTSFQSCSSRPNAFCFSRLNKNGSVERGCVSDLGLVERDNCLKKNSQNCTICSTSLCNYHRILFSTKSDVQSSSSGLGRWQDLPLKCYTCNGEENCKSKPALKTCEMNNLQDCMVVFDDSGEVIHRGCSDEVETAFGDYCNENVDRCYNCRSNGCNTAESKDLYKSCIECESSETEACLRNPSEANLPTRMCQSDCMTALYPVDLNDKPAYEIIRTCLDDMEIVNQTQCASGNGKMCKTCKQSNCNKMDIVEEERLKCYICSGDDCEIPKSLPCHLFKENDKCFTWFDESNSVKEMGCLSSLSNISMESLYSTKRVSVCDSGNNCNDLNKIQQQQPCIKCISSQDENCAVDPFQIDTPISCTQLPFTECSSFITNTGETWRGCLHDLPPEDYVSCLMNNSGGNCSHCVGNGCNREIFPKDRLQCYTCSSEDDPNCESFPEKMMPCPFLRQSEHCVTAFDGNETQRGCASQVLCDVNDKGNCRHCSKTGCNTIDLRNLHHDEDVGRWQSLPLKCHNCSEEGCANSLGPALTCTGNDRQVCVTVFDANDKIKRRGCSDDVQDYEDVYCRKNPNKCFYCKSNNCNVALNIGDFIDCVNCDSQKNPLCASYPQNYTTFENRKCFKSCMAVLNGPHIIRSCLDDMEVVDRSGCSKNGIGKRCANCTGNHCNTFIFPPDRLKCHKCTDAWCRKTIPEYCPLYDADDACFAKFEFGEQVDYMGCESSENYETIVEWKAKKKLFRCFKNECNSLEKLPTPQSCITCNSLKTTECAVDPVTVNTTKLCLPPFSQCFIKITQDGSTHRGCTRDLSTVEYGSCDGSLHSLCDICVGDNCNDNIFPKNRRRCHICGSTNNYTECKDSESFVPVCPVYAPNDKCIVNVEGGKTIERGCLTEMSCPITDPRKCVICDYDGCNSRNLISGATFSINSFPLIISICLFKLFGFLLS